MPIQRKTIFLARSSKWKKYTLELVNERRPRHGRCQNDRAASSVLLVFDRNRTDRRYDHVSQLPENNEDETDEQIQSRI